ncbi:MAG: hypothetical protein EBS88_09235 [Betaproteobacteria bacterium]|nr:hypothetical protein [Betaproteobacteria bacterium]
MKKTCIRLATFLLASLLSISATAKLPALSDEAKAKAAEAAAKTAHGNKVADYQPSAPAVAAAPAAAKPSAAPAPAAPAPAAPAKKS